MHMLAIHAELFKQYLAEYSQKIYGYLKGFCTHKNPKVRYVAFSAVDAFFTQVSITYLCAKFVLTVNTGLKCNCIWRQRSPC